MLQALELDPNAERRVDLAEILLSLNEYPAAAEQASAAVEMDPRFAPAHYCLGIALVRQGQIDEALPHLQEAVQAGHRSASSLLESGLAFQSRGDVALAIESFVEILKENPREPAAYFHLSKFLLAGHYEFSAEQIEQIRSMLKSQQGDSSAAAWLRFSLGNHYEAKQEFAESFEHFRKANEIERQVLEASTNACSWSGLSTVVDRLIRYFDEKRIASLNTPGNPSRRPVFVVGLPRSGTTLCCQVLASHPEIVSVGESPALGQSLQTLRSHWDTDAPKDTIDQQLICSAATQYLESVSAINADARLTVDKLPDNAMYIGFIHALLPNAPIIHCRRDPRDIAISSFSIAFQSERLKWETSSLETIAETIRQKTRLSRHWRNVLPGRVTELFYESFVESPRAETQRLLDRIGVGWADSCQRPEQQPAIVESASSIQVRSPIYRSSSGRWKRFQSQLQPLLEMLQSEITEYESELADSLAAND